MATNIYFVAFAVIGSLVAAGFSHNFFRDLVVRYPIFAILSEAYIIMMIILVLYAQVGSSI